MSERNAIELTLWVFTISFAVKTAVFGTLGVAMLRQRSETTLGHALLWHYLSLAVQACCLTLLYLYYATVQQGWGRWLPFAPRMALYGVSCTVVLWVVVSGIRLILAYRRETTMEEARP